MTTAYGTVGNESYVNPFSPTGQGAAPSVTYGAVNTPTVPTTLNSSNLKSSSLVTLPTPPIDSTNYAGILANGNAQAQAIQAGIDALTAAKTPPVTPPPTTPTDTSTQDASIYQKILAMIKPPEAPGSVSGSYVTAEQNAGITGLQANVNTNQAAVIAAQSKLAAVNAKLAGINGEATAQNLGLQNEGGKITTTGVSTASNQNIRDAAIRAIPIQVEVMGAQAEVAAAQGNVQLSQQILSQAQDHLDKSFQLQQKDVENKYKYQVDMYNAALDVADKAETRRLEAKKAEATQAFTTQQNNLNNAQSIAATALSNGQATVASKITQLDPKSPTFTTDLAKLQAQVTPKSTAPRIIGSASTGYYQVNADGSTTPVHTPPAPTIAPNTSIPTASVTKLKDALNASKFSGPEADGKYANPALYLQNYQDWTNKGGSAEAFFKAFPPATYVNPNNTWLPPEIMRFVPKPKTDGGISNPFK